MRWVASVSSVVLYLALEGTVSPLAFGPILPDMLECAPRRDGRAAGKDDEPDEHTTNLVRDPFGLPTPLVHLDRLRIVSVAWWRGACAHR